MAVNREEFELILRDHLNPALKEALGNIDKLRGKTERVSSSFNKLARTAGAAIAALGLGKLAKDAFDLAAGFEQTEIAFTTLLGSSEKAKSLLKDLDEFANVTPFTNEEVTKASKGLLAYGIEADRLIPTLTAIGNVTSAAGKEKLPQLILALGQVKAATKLTGNELRQFTEATVPMLDLLAESMGKSAPEVSQLVREGKIGFSDVERALFSASEEGGKFFNMMERQSQTTSGRISTLVGKLQLIGRAIGRLMLPAVSAITEKFIQMADWVMTNIETLKGWLDLFVKFAPTIGTFLGVIGAVIVATKAWAAAQTLLAIAMNITIAPITLVVGAIALVAAGLMHAWNNSETFRKALFGLWEAAKQVFTNIGNFFKKIFEPIFSAIDNFQKGNLKDAAIDAAKAAFNLSPAGLLVNALNTDFTKGVSDAFSKGAKEGAKSFAEAQSGGGVLDALTGASAVQENPLSKALAATGATTSGKLGLAETNVSSTAPKVFNLNIESLVDNLTVSTTTLNQSVDQIKDKMIEALLLAVNDTQKAIR